MLISFRKTFHPTEDEKRKHEEALKKIHDKCVEEKSCTVCKHYTFDNQIPGYCIYYGDCDLGLDPFFSRKEECEYWEN